jgi:hypothetical protein
MTVCFTPERRSDCDGFTRTPFQHSLREQRATRLARIATFFRRTGYPDEEEWTEVFILRSSPSSGNFLSGTTYVPVFDLPQEDEDMSTEMIVLVVVLVLLFGGGGGYWYSRR